MIGYAIRLGGAVWFRLLGRAAANREALFGGSTGLRILTFHDIPPRHFGVFRALVEWCLDRFEAGTPEDADALAEGRWDPPARDRVLFTFDDGLASHLAAAEWLTLRGIRASFFLVPSLLGRGVGDFLAQHRRRGVVAFAFDPSTRPLSRSQAREIAAMGHRLGAHNNAHRDLAGLHRRDDLEYEIAAAIAQVADLTNSPCEDFAIAFGQPGNLSGEATRYLLGCCRRVYSCVRGLNVPGRAPRFLLRGHVVFEHPPAFTRLCIEGGADHLMAARHVELARGAGIIPAARDARPAADPEG